MINTVREAKEATGGLSKTSKMPCLSYSIPAETCITGAKLVNVENSICKDCYAMKGNYIRFAKVIKPKQYERYGKLFDKQWVEGMVHLINKQCNNGFFRWHDSGDVQSLQHIKRIAKVCEKTPDIMHWLPTREYSIIKEYLKNNKLPSNLTIRLSAHMIEGKAPSICNLPTSTVSSKDYNCPAYKQEGKCLDCRKCWDPKIKNIAYKLH